MEYYETELIQHYARAAMPEELYESLVSCVPEHLHCANLFVMTNLASASENFQTLQAQHASACGPNRLHSLDTLMALIPERPSTWGKLHVFLLDMAISVRANFFLGYGGGWAGDHANAGSLVVQQLRLVAGRSYWCAAWMHDDACSYAGARTISDDLPFCST